MKFENNSDGYRKMAEYLIKQFGDINNYKIKNNKNISAIFLAGAPGAGKTEFLETIFKDLKENFIIIDIDKYRNLFKGYNGENSRDYQKGSVKVADKILKFCFKNNLNFVFDGTFRNYNKIKQNFSQCKKYSRNSLIALIFQDPRISFYYTFLRKVNKKRNVPIDVFIDGFYNSIENTFKVIKKFNNVELIIAYKKYNLLNKEQYRFDVDYKTKDIISFCKRYRILYKKGEFLNRELLKFDILKYNNILEQEFLGTKTIWGRIKLWCIEKINKI